MEELHFNRTLNQVLGIDDNHLDIDFYANQKFVKHHVVPNQYPLQVETRPVSWLLCYYVVTYLSSECCV